MIVDIALGYYDVIASAGCAYHHGSGQIWISTTADYIPIHGRTISAQHLGFDIPWYPAYQNLYGQNILYLLRVMTCDKSKRYTSIISFVTTRLPYDWLNEVKGRLTWWKAWAHHDAAACGSHERERGKHICWRSSCCQMVPPMISTIESGQSGTHHWH